MHNAFRLFKYKFIIYAQLIQLCWTKVLPAEKRTSCVAFSRNNGRTMQLGFPSLEEILLYEFKQWFVSIKRVVLSRVTHSQLQKVIIFYTQKRTCSLFLTSWTQKNDVFMRWYEIIKLKKTQIHSSLFFRVKLSKSSNQIGYIHPGCTTIVLRPKPIWKRNF